MVKNFLKGALALPSYPYKKELVNGVGLGWFPVFIKYPVYPEQRYGTNGEGFNPHLYEIINQGRAAYEAQLAALMQYEDYFLRIKTNQPPESQLPHWNNPWFSGLDAMALYGFIATGQPSLYLEIGSGNSTKFARQAITDHALSTTIISVDPHPREEIDALSDEVIRIPLERSDLSLFERLTKDDILFFDGSHRCFMNSDVTVFFLDIMPKLPSGILIHIHDIHLPYDYPPERALHYESEQYLLAAMLLGDCSKYETILPNEFIVRDKPLASRLNRLWESKQVTIPKRGMSFWMKKR